MADYFTRDHFKLLKRWQGKKCNSSDPEQKRAYEDLKKAYEVTGAWANKVKEELFPKGHVKIHKRPTNQRNNFMPYLWAKIYPWSGAPKELSYNVSIDSDYGFAVKIDTVGLGETNPTRRAYLTLRGPHDNTSPFVAKMPAADGLDKSLEQLADWSIKAIRNFSLSYEDVVSQLKLEKTSSDKPRGRREDTDNDKASYTAETRQPFNRIYYGPPGTGKTFKLSKLLRDEYEQDMSAMSAPEWRSQFIAEKIAVLKW